MGDLVLALAGELMTFDFWPTFTDAFSVSNKVSEAAVGWRGGGHQVQMNSVAPRFLPACLCRLVSF